MAQKYGLGRGLSSLIPQKTVQQSDPHQKKVSHKTEKKETSQKKESQSHNNSTERRDFVEEISIGRVRANSQQPRIYFDEEKLDELSLSIKAHGVLQPLIAVHNGDHYELIAGERRLRASKKAGLKTVPVVVKNKEDFGEQKKLELALIENIQRHDLNIIEEARSYHKLANEFELSQEEIAVRTGKSRSSIANRMRLLSLPIDIQKGIIAGDIMEGHAKVILGLETIQKQIALYNMIIGEKLTVRQAENRLLRSIGTARKKKITEKTPHARRLENQLTQYFGTKVRVSENSNGGSITVSYFSDDELKNVLSRLKLI